MPVLILVQGRKQGKSRTNLRIKNIVFWSNWESGTYISKSRSFLRKGLDFPHFFKGHCAIWPILIPQIWWFLKYINPYICVYILKYYYISVSPVKYLAAWSLVSYRKVITYIPTQGAVDFITMLYIPIFISSL